MSRKIDTGHWLPLSKLQDGDTVIIEKASDAD